MSNKRAVLMRPLKLYAGGHLALLVGMGDERDRFDGADGTCRIDLPDADRAADSPLPHARGRAPLIALVAPLV